MFGTGITKLVYTIQRRTTMDAGAIACSIVRDRVPNERNTMEVFTTMKNMKTRWIKNAEAVRCRLVIKQSVT